MGDKNSLELLDNVKRIITYNYIHIYRYVYKRTTKEGLCKYVTVTSVIALCQLNELKIGYSGNLKTISSK